MVSKINIEETNCFNQWCIYVFNCFSGGRFQTDENAFLPHQNCSFNDGVHASSWHHAYVM